jgi:hypothetical protein
VLFRSSADPPYAFAGFPQQKQRRIGPTAS